MLCLIKRFALVPLIAAATTLPLAAGFAAPLDYRFEIADQPVKAGHDATIVVRLLQVTTGKPVTNASITSQSLHMVMGNMDPATKIQPLAQDENGDYRFAADLTMFGEWTLDLVASVPGENEPLHSSLKVQVAK